MPLLLFFVPSESCSIDASSNRVSLFHVCEQLNLAAFPGLIPQMSVVTLWERRSDESDDDKFTQTIVLRDPDGSVLCQTQASFQLKRRRHRLISIVNNLPIHRAGFHRFSLHLHEQGEEPSDDNLVKTYPIEVQQVQPRPAPGAPPSLPPSPPQA